MDKFVNVNIKVNGGGTVKIKMEKGVSFEDFGGIYALDKDGQLCKFDKKTNIWSVAESIEMNKYQYQLFKNIADNDGDVHTYSAKDIKKAQELYGQSKFIKDISQDLPMGYRIESTDKKTKAKAGEDSVSALVKYKDETNGVTLKFKMGDIAPSEELPKTKTDSATTAQKPVEKQEPQKNQIPQGSVAPKTDVQPKPTGKKESKSIAQASKTIVTDYSELGVRFRKVERNYVERVEAFDVYLVRSGDIYENLAKQFHVTCDALKEANPKLDLNGNVQKDAKGKTVGIPLIAGKTELTIPQSKRMHIDEIDTYEKAKVALTEYTGIEQGFFDLIKMQEDGKLEGFKTKAYRVKDEKTKNKTITADPTIGIGHSLTDTEMKSCKIKLANGDIISLQKGTEPKKTNDGTIVLQATYTISQEDVIKLFASDMITKYNTTRNLIGPEAYDKIELPLRKALLDLSFNGGIIDGMHKAAKNNNRDEFVKLITKAPVTHSKIPERGLYKRRLFEMGVACKAYPNGKIPESVKKEIMKFYMKGKAHFNQDEEYVKVANDYFEGMNISFD